MVIYHQNRLSKCHVLAPVPDPVMEHRMYMLGKQSYVTEQQLTVVMSCPMTGSLVINIVSGDISFHTSTCLIVCILCIQITDFLANEKA